MKIGDIVKSRHTEQEYKVVEVNKKHKCAYVCVPINPEKYTFLMMKLQLRRISHGKDVLFKILKN